MATRYGFNAGPQGPPGNSTGPAGGDLGGTFPTPDVLKIHGTSVPASPANGTALLATSTTSSSWGLTPGLYPATGLTGGCIMTKNGTNPAAFDITAGTGVVVDYHTNYTSPTVTVVSIPAQTVVLSGPALTRVVSWWVADSTGAISALDHQPTHDERRTLIQLGITGILSGSLTAVISAPAYTAQPANTLYDLMYALGSFVINGARVTANGANMQINLSAGTMYTPGLNYGNSRLDPSTYDVLAAAPSPFFYATRVASSSVAATVIDPTRYDANGVVTLIGGGSNASTIQRVYAFSTGNTSTQLSIQYGQSIHASLADAVTAAGKSLTFVQNPDFANANGVLVAYLCMTRLAASLQDSANVQIIPAGKFAVP